MNGEDTKYSIAEVYTQVLITKASHLTVTLHGPTLAHSPMA